MIIDKSGAACGANECTVSSNAVNPEFGKIFKAAEPHTTNLLGVMAMVKSAREGARLAFNFIGDHHDDSMFNEWMSAAGDPDRPMQTIDIVNFFDYFCRETIQSGRLNESYLFEGGQIDDIYHAYEFFKLAKHIHKLIEIQRIMFFA